MADRPEIRVNWHDPDGDATPLGHAGRAEVRQPIPVRAYSPYSIEGQIESLGDFAEAANNKDPRSRSMWLVTRVGLFALVGIPIISLLTANFSDLLR